MMLNYNQKSAILRELQVLLAKGMPFPVGTDGKDQAVKVAEFIEEFGTYLLLSDKK